MRSTRGGEVRLFRFRLNLSMFSPKTSPVRSALIRSSNSVWSSPPLVRLQHKKARVFQLNSKFGAKLFCDAGPAAAKKAGFLNYSNFGAKIFCDVGPAAAKKAGFWYYSNFGAKMFCVTSRSGWQMRLTQYGCRSVAGIDRWTACSRCFSFVPGFASASIEQEHYCYCLKIE
jgi:hypothetical protein